MHDTVCRRDKLRQGDTLNCQSIKQMRQSIRMIHRGHRPALPCEFEARGLADLRDCAAGNRIQGQIEDLDLD